MAYHAFNVWNCMLFEESLEVQQVARSQGTLAARDLQTTGIVLILRNAVEALCRPAALWKGFGQRSRGSQADGRMKTFHRSFRLKSL